LILSNLKAVIRYFKNIKYSINPLNYFKKQHDFLECQGRTWRSILPVPYIGLEPIRIPCQLRSKKKTFILFCSIERYIWLNLSAVLDPTGLSVGFKTNEKFSIPSYSFQFDNKYKSNYLCADPSWLGTSFLIVWIHFRWISSWA